MFWFLHLQSPDSVVKEEYVGWSDGIFVVFSISDYSSFVEAQEIARGMLSAENTNIPVVVLVGNKTDLRHLRQVSVAQATELAATFDCQYMETSASDNAASVEAAFQSIFREILQKHKNGEKKSSGTHHRLLKVKQTLLSLADFRGRTNTL